jgi:hypothetical protein
LPDHFGNLCRLRAILRLGEQFRIFGSSGHRFESIRVGEAERGAPGIRQSASDGKMRRISLGRFAIDRSGGIEYPFGFLAT